MPESSLNIDSHSAAHLTCTVALYRSLVDYCRQQGIAIRPLLEIASLTEDDLNDIDRRIPVQAFDTALETAAELSGDPCFGIHFGEDIKPGHYGAVGLAAMSCEKAGELLHFQLRFQALVSDSLFTQISDSPLGLELQVKPKLASFTQNRVHEETAFSSWITLARWITGLKDQYPQRVNFTSAPPPDPSEHHRVFGPNIFWQQAQLSITFSHALMDSRIPQANPQLRQQLEAQALEQLRALGALQAPLLVDVQQRITQQLCDGNPEINAVAEQLGITTRTLQRKLSELDSSFSQLLDQTRHDLAMGYIKQPKLSLTEIAFLLGFSEQSAFNRAFKRWTQMPPAEYRKSIGSS